MGTTEPSTSGLAALLSALRTVPVWMLAGLAVSGFAVLFLPAFGGVDPSDFRRHWGVWVWVGAITCSVLAITRAIDAGFSAIRKRRIDAENSLALRLFAEPHRCWWHHALQQDDRSVTQISIDVVVTNVTDRPVRIVHARLVSPKMKGEVLHSDISLPVPGTQYHSDRQSIPPHETMKARLQMMIRGSVSAQGSRVRVAVELADQFGSKYLLKLLLPTFDSPLPRRPFFERLSSKLPTLSNKQPASTAIIPAVWVHGGKFDQVDVILNEEIRAYAAHGRRMGGLGSLNVRLQSEPNFGGTSEGKVPILLWPKDQAKLLDSANLTMLLKLHDGLNAESRSDVEEYLLSHVNKASPFADVAYFIFLALHRLNRMLDALRTARKNLVGDKVYAYSNLLGTLSALMSHEHFQIDPTLYSEIQKILAGDQEPNFRLNEKINAARLQQLDSKLREVQSSPAGVDSV